MMRMASARGDWRYLSERLSLRLPLLHWQHRLHLCRCGSVALVAIAIRCGSRKVVFLASYEQYAASSERSGVRCDAHCMQQIGFCSRSALDRPALQEAGQGV